MKEHTEEERKKGYELLKKAGLIDGRRKYKEPKQKFSPPPKEERHEVYKRWEDYLIKRYLIIVNKERISYLTRNVVVKILAEAFPEDNISGQAVAHFLMKTFEKDGKQSYRIPEGHPLNRK